MQCGYFEGVPLDEIAAASLSWQFYPRVTRIISFASTTSHSLNKPSNAGMSSRSERTISWAISQNALNSKKVQRGLDDGL